MFLCSRKVQHRRVTFTRFLCLLASDTLMIVVRLFRGSPGAVSIYRATSLYLVVLHTDNMMIVFLWTVGEECSWCCIEENKSLYKFTPAISVWRSNLRDSYHLLCTIQSVWPGPRFGFPAAPLIGIWTSFSSSKELLFIIIPLTELEHVISFANAEFNS